MDNSRTKDYPNLSYHKPAKSGNRGHRISLGNLNDNLVGGEKKRHVKDYRDNHTIDRVNEDNNAINGERQKFRRHRQMEDDDYDDDFRRMSIGSPIPNNQVNPDGSPRKQNRSKGHYPSIKVDQVRESDARSRGRINKRLEYEHRVEPNYDEEDDQAAPKSPASPLPSPRSRNGDQGVGKQRRIPPPSSPRLLRSRSPNNLSPRSPSPSPRVAGGKEFIAYYEEDVDLRPKSTSPRDKKQDRIPNLGKSSIDSNLSYSKRPSPRDKHQDDNFDWNNYMSPRSNTSNQDDEDSDERYSPRSKTSPREYKGRNRGDKRQERARESVESPPLSPLSSSGGSSFRSPRESPRSPDDVRSSRESPRSDQDYSPREDFRSMPQISRRKKQMPSGGKLEPIDYR